MKSPNKIKIGQNFVIGPDQKCFIIAEIGQNHQGDLNMAKQMILLAKKCGANCVKFQKSHLPAKFNKNALLRPYVGPNSWGKTYGDHKKYLEFSNENFVELKKFSENVEILFSSSAMDEVSLMFLDSLDLPFIKIGSGESHNKKLLQKAANLRKPLIVSTGMLNENEVVDIYNLLKSYHKDFCLLHCISSYPTPPQEINLNVIKSYINLFPDVNIGYSGHEIGIDIPLAAVALGAKVIEKHFTLDKSLKGSDHICSLTPSEFEAMVCNIRNFENNHIPTDDIFCKKIVQIALGNCKKKFQNSEKACYEKLGKTIVAAVKLEKDDVLTWENISCKVAEPKGIPSNLLSSILGARVNRIIEEDESIFLVDIN